MKILYDTMLYNRQFGLSAGQWGWTEALIKAAAAEYSVAERVHRARTMAVSIKLDLDRIETALLGLKMPGRAKP